MERDEREALRKRLMGMRRLTEFLRLQRALRKDGMGLAESWDEAARQMGLDSPRAEEVEDFGAYGATKQAVPRGDRTKGGLRKEQFAAEKMRADVEAEVRFVFNHLDVDDVRPEDAPSPGAWSLLTRLRENPDLLTDFYKTVWVKILPTKSQLEQKARFKDDGRNVLECIQRVQDALAAAKREEEAGA